MLSLVCCLLYLSQEASTLVYPIPVCFNTRCLSASPVEAGGCLTYVHYNMLIVHSRSCHSFCTYVMSGKGILPRCWTHGDI